MKRIVSFILLLSILVYPIRALAFHEEDSAGVIPSDLGLDAAASLLPADALSLDGEAILVYERRTGTLVYGKNVDAARYPASLTKLMTCLLALEHSAPWEEVTVTSSALETLDPSGSFAGLWPGETYTMEQLLYCLMVQSANDAALVIAEYIGGSQESFVEMMNDKAEELGCTGTHFVNPHGMHDPDHYSTARDLAKITEAAMEYDLFRSLYSTASYVLPATDTREERTLNSTNYLISTAINAEYYDSRVIGGKTGFTTPAGRCVMCTAIDEEYAYLAVILGASGTDEAGKTVYGGFITASALFDTCLWGFSKADCLEAGQQFTAEVPGGAWDALLIATEDVTALLPVSYDPALLSYIPSLDPELEAPLEEDQAAGSLLVYYGDVLVGEAPLYTLEAVDRVSPPPAAKADLAPGRFPEPLGNPWCRLPFRL